MHSKQTYIGLCNTSFKACYRNHTCSFRNERYRNSTELRKYVWGLKDKKTDYQIRWRSIRHARSYSNVTKKCNSCMFLGEVPGADPGGGCRGCAPPPGMTCGRFLINTVQSLDRHTKSALSFDMYSQQFTLCYFLVKSPLLRIRF